MRSLVSILLVLGLVACDPAPAGDLCSRTFKPYPDMISGRVRTNLNGTYLDAMALYAKEDFRGARDGLKLYLEQKGFEQNAHMYLACAYLATGEPFEAELQLDHLEKANTMQFKDQTEWYTVVCLLCSDQLDRALAGAKAIATSKSHTYKAEAVQLVEELHVRQKK